MFNMVKKIIKKYGNTFVITFTPEERLIFNLEVGEVVEFNIKKIYREE